MQQKYEIEANFNILIAGTVKLDFNILNEMEASVILQQKILTYLRTLVSDNYIIVKDSESYLKIVSIENTESIVNQC